MQPQRSETACYSRYSRQMKHASDWLTGLNLPVTTAIVDQMEPQRPETTYYSRYSRPNEASEA